MHDFAALAAVSAAYDTETSELLRKGLEGEPGDGPFSDLVVRLIALATPPEA